VKYRERQQSRVFAHFTSTLDGGYLSNSRCHIPQPYRSSENSKPALRVLLPSLGVLSDNFPQTREFLCNNLYVTRCEPRIISLHLGPAQDVPCSHQNTCRTFSEIDYSISLCIVHGAIYIVSSIQRRTSPCASCGRVCLRSPLLVCCVLQSGSRANMRLATMITRAGRLAAYSTPPTYAQESG